MGDGTTPQGKNESGFDEFPNKNINRRIAVGTSLAAVGLFAFSRLDFGSVSLKDLSAAALPYEEVCFIRSILFKHFFHFHILINGFFVHFRKKEKRIKKKYISLLFLLCFSCLL